MERHLPLIGGAALLLAGVYMLVKLKNAVGNAVSDPAALAENAATGAVNIASSAAAGVVTGAGLVLGVPKTDLTQCQKDQAAGDTWAASFSCPASDFISYWWNK